MKPKGLLVAAVLLAVLGGVIWWSNKKQAGKPATGSSITMLSIPDDQFQTIRIKKLTNEVIELRRENGKWAMTQPKPLPADQDVAGSLVSALGALSADKVVEEKAADLQAFGLHVPTLDITIGRKDGKTSELLVGDTAPDASQVYAKLANDPRIFTIASSTKSTLDRNPEDFRDKRLLTFDPDKLSRVELQAKGQTIEFGKNGQNEWQIVKPRPLRADSSAVGALVDKLRDAKLDTSELPEDAAKKFASASRVALAILTDAGGNQTLEIRKDKENNYYAKSSVVEGVFKTDSEVGEAVDKTLNDFRSKKLFEFGFSDPTKVELKNAAYVKNGDKWTSGGKTMDNAAVQTLIDKLRDLTATGFVDAGAGEPVFTATVTSDEGKRVEKVTISKQGSRYLAKREGDPSIYELDGASVDGLQKAAAEIKEAPAQQSKK